MVIHDPDQVASTARIRRARPDEAALLSEVGLRSKGHWNYDQAFLATCRDDLALSPDGIAANLVYVEEHAGVVRGYYQLLLTEPGSAELDALFVDPAAIGQGVGRRLWNHAVSTASAHGCREITLQSDPHAEGFYRAMGAVRVGESGSTVQPGRLLPLMRFVLVDGT